MKLKRLHAAAGTLALMTIVGFWTSTVLAETLGGHATIAGVKTAVLWGMLLLVPAIVTTALTGRRLAGRRSDARIVAKRRRMPLIAANGVVVLLPAAVFLALRAAAGAFDTMFYAVQAIELLAGAANITLMAFSIRDGLALGRARRAV